MAAPPTARVSAFTSTSFTVTLTAVTGVGTDDVHLETRTRGGTDDFVQADSIAAPAVGATLTASGLTSGVPMEWRLREFHGSTLFYEGSWGLVTPGDSLWPSILSTLSAVLLGTGLAAAYEGTALPPNYEDHCALMLTRQERVVRSGNNVETVEYPIEVEIRVTETSDTAELRTQSIATYQRALYAAAHRKGAETFPDVAGLELVTVEIKAKDDARSADDFGDETRARALVKFLVNEARV